MKIQNHVPLTNPRANEDLDSKFKEVSKLYEKQFLREMVKSMRSTVHEGGFIQSNQAEKIFRDQLDNEYVESWGDQGGIGMSDLIYKQLQERFGQNSMRGRGLSKPKGPLPINQESQFNMKSRMNSQGLQTQMRLKTPPLDGSRGPQTNDPKTNDPKKEDAVPLPKSNGSVGVKSSVSLNMPWGGQLLKAYQVPSDSSINAQNLQVIELDHGDGLKSQFVGAGLRLNPNSGDLIEAGQPFAQLETGRDPSFYWSVHRAQNEV